MAFDLTGKSPELLKTPAEQEAAKESEAHVEVSEPETAVEAPQRMVVPEKSVQMIEMPKEQPKQKVIEIKDQMLAQIEEILADGLYAIYKVMPANKQLEFKVAGEKFAREIKDQIAKGKMKPHLVLRGARIWLSKIPGVIWPYLTQEAKIKTDDILVYSEELIKGGKNSL